MSPHVRHNHMTTKQTISLLVIFLLVCGAFAAGRLWTGTNTVLKDLSCLVYSDTEVRDHLLSAWSIPEKSYRLYYAQCGFPDSDKFIAFSASQKDCLVYLKSLNGISPTNMELTSEIPNWVLERSPKQKRPALDHTNWDLSPDKKYLLKESDFGLVIYDKDINRIYICK